jgi:RNA polymerase sigma-54 factor
MIYLEIMKMNQKVAIKLQNQMLQGFDLQMVQSIYELPGYLLSDFVSEYCHNHPALELMFRDNKSLDIDYSWVEEKQSLYEHLAFQIKTGFFLREKEEALNIAASLDRKGFYEGEVTPVLEKIWFLDPIGVGARNPCEALKIQLIDKKRENSLAYKILDESYQYFLKRNISMICKKHKSSKEEAGQAIEEIKTLIPFPGIGFDDQISKHVTAEMILTFDKKWILSFVKEHYPPCRLITTAKGRDKIDALRFIHLLNKRKSRLEWLVAQIVKKQSRFLSGKGELTEFHRSEIEGELGVSQSTLSRILSEKFIETPMGVFSLGYFFSHKSKNPVNKAKIILTKLIESENKFKPLTDEELKDSLIVEGIKCSRRSVAKYRQALMIPGAYDRCLK